jgi:hypothetical protein
VIKRQYVICTNCIMDTFDSGIRLAASGWCDYFNSQLQQILPNWHRDEVGEEIISRQQIGQLIGTCGVVRAGAGQPVRVQGDLPGGLDQLSEPGEEV